MEWLNELVKIVPPSNAHNISNGSTQDDSGKFPESYTTLVNTYGPGYFDDFLYLLSLNNENKYLDARFQTRAQRDALHTVNASGERLPDRIESIDDLLVWAMTDNGDVCYWMPSGTGGCVVIMDSRAPEWCFYDMGVTEFMYRLLRKDIIVPIFPPDFPSTIHTFSRL